MPLYFSAGGLNYIVADIGGTATSSWLPVAYTLSAAIPIPFTGYLQDIFGRRPIALASTVLVIIGAIIMGTAHSFGQGVVGMVFCGAGAGIAELSALAGFGHRTTAIREEADVLFPVSLKSFPFEPGVTVWQS